MSEWLTVAQTVHRDEGGNILPEVMEVEGITNEDGSHPKIKFLPIPRGKFLRLTKAGTTDRPTDEQLIIEHILLPKFTAEHVAEFDLKTLNALIFALISGSTGMSQEDVRQKTMKAAIDDNEAWIKKK